jgi:hypothetical protein
MTNKEFMKLPVTPLEETGVVPEIAGALVEGDPIVTTDKRGRAWGAHRIDGKLHRFRRPTFDESPA